jgi:hypothetical protein
MIILQMMKYWSAPNLYDPPFFSGRDAASKTSKTAMFPDPAVPKKGTWNRVTGRTALATEVECANSNRR